MTLCIWHTIEITGYQTGIKLRHEMKSKEFQMNSISNFVAAKQVILEIINKFFNSIPNDGS
jgi:hypothetical protein